MSYAARTLEGKTRIFDDDVGSIDISKVENDIVIDLDFYLGNGGGIIVNKTVARHMANTILRLCDEE